MPNRIIWSFIEKQEGSAILNAYVPQKHGVAIGNSGTTVGSGYDIGNHNLEELQSLGLSDELVSKLSPYLVLTKDDAINFLRDNPLTISQDECDELSTAEESQEYDNMERIYDKCSEVPFGDLTSTQQTIIISVSYQYGNLPHACPHFWSMVIVQEWQSVIDILRHFGDSYANRRNAEADLLESSL